MAKHKSYKVGSRRKFDYTGGELRIGISDWDCEPGEEAMLERLQGKSCEITCVAIDDGPLPIDHYYDIKFQSGDELHGVQGYSIQEEIKGLLEPWA